MVLTDYSIAVLIPCWNEEQTVADVITSFRQQLPQARIYVYDNNSTDKTAAVAAGAGAIVRHEPRQGKGNVMRRMFADIDSDIYIMVDGDSTYPAESVTMLVQALVERKLDMVVATRLGEEGAFTLSRGAGNDLLNRVVRLLFGRGIKDICSGYRIFSNRFVKSFPGLSRGFDIEAELSIYAFDLRLPFAEIPVSYKSRPSGSSSKLHICRDGLRIMGRIILMFREAMPLRFFSLTGVALLAVALVLGYPRAALALMAVSLASGLLLEDTARMRRENKRLHYLSLSGLNEK